MRTINKLPVHACTQTTLQPTHSHHFDIIYRVFFLLSLCIYAQHSGITTATIVWMCEKTKQIYPSCMDEAYEFNPNIIVYAASDIVHHTPCSR